MAMQTTSDNRSAEPMLEINMTPLIDVLLVLIIMFIITIPPQTHAVKLDLPTNQQNNTPPPVDPIKNKVVVTQAGAILWNGTPVGQDERHRFGFVLGRGGFDQRQAFDGCCIGRFVGRRGERVPARGCGGGAHCFADELFAGLKAAGLVCFMVRAV